MAENGRLPAIISNIKIEVLPKVSDLAGNFTRLWIILSLLVVSFLVLPPQVAHADPAGVTVQRYYSIWEDEWTTTSTSLVFHKLLYNERACQEWLFIVKLLAIH